MNNRCMVTISKKLCFSKNWKNEKISTNHPLVDNHSKNWEGGSMSILRRIGAWSPITGMLDSSMHRTYSLRYGSFYIRKLIRTRFFAHHRRNIRKYNTRFTFIRNCVTVVMYRCEMASQRNKNQCHSLYRFLINWFLPRLHVEEMLDFDGSGYFANCTITWSVWKRFYL